MDGQEFFFSSFPLFVRGFSVLRISLFSAFEGGDYALAEIVVKGESLQFFSKRLKASSLRLGSGIFQTNTQERSQ